MGEAVGAETLHPAAFMIDADQQVIAHRLDRRCELGELPPVAPVAREQDHAADERVRQARAILWPEFQAGDVDDEGGLFDHVQCALQRARCGQDASVARFAAQAPPPAARMQPRYSRTVHA